MSSKNTNIKPEYEFTEADYKNLAKQIEPFIKTDSGGKVISEIMKIQMELDESINILNKDLKKLN
jgi:hypothetical protein